MYARGGHATARDRNSQHRLDPSSKPTEDHQWQNPAQPRQETMAGRRARGACLKRTWSGSPYSPCAGVDELLQVGRRLMLAAALHQTSTAT